jgi:hypothetical protein
MPYAGVTEYATAFSNSPSTSHTIALNSTFMTDANNTVGVVGDGGYVHIMLLHENDFKENDTLLLMPETTAGFVGSADGARFSTMEDSTSANRPAIILKAADGSTISTMNPAGTGNLDDGYFFAASTVLGGDAVDCRNSTAASSINQTITSGLTGHARISFFGTVSYVIYRMFLSFNIGSLSGSTATIVSADLKLNQVANQTGFFPIASTKKTHVCKVTSVGSGWVVADYNNLDNWRSSDTYEAEEGDAPAVTHNANFFGSNF